MAALSPLKPLVEVRPRLEPWPPSLEDKSGEHVAWLSCIWRGC